MAKHIFRKAALDRLASPEQLDTLVFVTTPFGWISLLGIGLMLIAVFVWSIYGNIPTTASGGGILIKKGGVVSVNAPVSGQIANLFVSEGDRVTKGQVIGKMAQPKLEDEIRSKKLALSELEGREEQLEEFGIENLNLTAKAIAQEKESLNIKISVDEDQKRWLKEKVQINENLLETGLIVRQELVDSQTQLNEVIARIETNRGLIKNLEARLLEATNSREQQLLMGQEAVNEARRQLALLEAELEFSSRLVSAFDGVVVEDRSYQGKWFSSGEPVVTLELTGGEVLELQALLYMPPKQGKQIKKGMLARVTPETVKREEYGYMIGIVSQVAEFPVSKQGMIRVLKNEVLADQFSAGGAPLAVYVNFIQDSQTASGYKWSSSKGPDFGIDSGTLCQGSVEVRTQTPISLAIPYLKKKLGLD